MLAIDRWDDHVSKRLWVIVANLLAAPLKEGRLQDQDLAAVQARREWPVRVIQGFQERMQKRIITQALQPGKPFHLPVGLRIVLRLPVLRNIPARMIAFGARRVRVEEGPGR